MACTGLTMVVPETTVKEARDRVRSAIVWYEFPAKEDNISTAPADLPKGAI